MPKLFESQRPLSPPPASAGLLGGGCGFRGGGCKCKMSPAKGGVNLVCCFPFLPTSRYTPLSPPPGDMCVFARDGGTLIVPTARVCLGTRLVFVALPIQAGRALRAGRVLGDHAQPRNTAPNRPQEETEWVAGASVAGPPIGHLPHPCAPVQLLVLCPCVCARVSKRESERDFKPCRPSTAVRAPPKQETWVFLPPPPQPVFPLFFLPPATRARF